MGSQPLSAKSLRRIAEATGLDLVRAVAHGGTHNLSIVTADHRHGSYRRSTGEVLWDAPGTVTHFSSCAYLFPDPAPHRHVAGEVMRADCPQ